MFFTTIINIIFIIQISPNIDQTNQDSISNFKSLHPSVYQDSTFQGNVFTYNKVPTKLIKIDKNSN